ncbi:hypothetical protein G5714_002566 [Onychostoma macrolepis]|uniref:Uncharacterized protein n=1 Tax=Onychostoma macrolepis TaxID=369639 RepID=A0A7J6D747_9TELE|nr:hypothetical protein G5714_002566 [Onychostoma macrolepis]
MTALKVNLSPWSIRFEETHSKEILWSCFPEGHCDGLWIGLRQGTRKVKAFFHCGLKMSDARSLQYSNRSTNKCGDVALCINFESTKLQLDRWICMEPFRTRREGSLPLSKVVCLRLVTHPLRLICFFQVLTLYIWNDDTLFCNSAFQSHWQIILMQCATSTRTKQGGTLAD